jgi:hypothetical protein
MPSPPLVDGDRRSDRSAGNPPSMDGERRPFQCRSSYHKSVLRWRAVEAARKAAQRLDSRPGRVSTWEPAEKKFPGQATIPPALAYDVTGAGANQTGSRLYFLAHRSRGTVRMANAWDHDWRQFARDRLRAVGCTSMLDYARRNDRLPYAALAEDLGQGRLAPVQIQMLLREETEGTSDYSYFVRSSLVRNLHAHVPRGFRMHGDRALILALASWAGSMGAPLQSPCGRIAKGLKGMSNLEETWLPRSVDDPVLEQVFSKEGL